MVRSGSIFFRGESHLFNNLLHPQQMTDLGNLSMEFLLPGFEAFDSYTFHWAGYIGDGYYFEFGRQE